MPKINKLLTIIILLSMCTGCTINYNLKINADTIDETIDVNDTITNERTKTDIYNEYQRWFPVYIEVSDTPMEYDSSIKIDGVEYHEKTIKELSNGYNYTYKYAYPIKEYNNASVLRQVFEKRKAYVGSDYITLKTDKINLLCNYSYFESIKVSITIDEEIYKVNTTNAHGINGDTYIWNLNRNNCNDSEIILTLDIIGNNSEQVDNGLDNNENQTNSDYMIYIFFGILILLILIGYFIFNKVKQKNDNFNEDD